MNTLFWEVQKFAIVASARRKRGGAKGLPSSRKRKAHEVTGDFVIGGHHHVYRWTPRKQLSAHFSELLTHKTAKKNSSVAMFVDQTKKAMTKKSIWDSVLPKEWELTTHEDAEINHWWDALTGVRPGIYHGSLSSALTTNPTQLSPFQGNRPSKKLTCELGDRLSWSDCAGRFPDGAGNIPRPPEGTHISNLSRLATICGFAINDLWSQVKSSSNSP